MKDSIQPLTRSSCSRLYLDYPFRSIVQWHLNFLPERSHRGGAVTLDYVRFLHPCDRYPSAKGVADNPNFLKLTT